MSLRQPRAWDAYDVYLFDIDGTLLSCKDAVHYFAFCEVLTLHAGRPMNLDGVMTHGNTDIGILRDAFQLANIVEHRWRSKLTEIRHQMCRFVETHANDLQIMIMPEVHRVLEHLRTQGAILGIATGNLEGIGRHKLDQCGLLQYFDFGGYSDLYEHRRDVFRSAVTQAKSISNELVSICVVGDTPEDIRSARANALDVIAVATGIYNFRTLEAEAPDWCLHSFADLRVNES